MKHRIIALLLAALLAGLTACGSAGTTDPDNSGNSSRPGETTADPAADALPEGLDFGGKTVTFLYRADIASEFYSEEANGELVSDALYESHASVEERLNVDINVVTMPGQNGADRNTYMNHITSTVMAGDDAYDWVDLMIGNAPVKMQEGIFLNLLDNEYMYLEKPWYLAGLSELVTVDGKLYFTSGDASLGYLTDTFCIFFNDRIAKDYGMESFYELVDSGDWTLDKLMELSAKASKDVDQDGTWDDGDQLGFQTCDQNHISGFLLSAEIPMFRQESGSWKFTFGADHDTAAIEKLYALYNETDGARLKHGANTVKFTNGEVLFITAEFDDAATKLREMKDTYGILPYPKFDRAQDGYRSGARSTHNSFSLVKTSADPSCAGAVLEALGSSNYRTVTPAYFEVALKVKYTVDNDSARMFDLIRNGTSSDFGYLFSNVVGNPVTEVFINSIKEGGFASKLASFKSSVDESLAAYLKAVRENID